MKTYHPLEDKISVAMEPAVALITKRAGRPLGIYTRPMLRSKIVRAGLPWSLFSRIQEVAPLTEAEWSVILDLSGKTLSRYAREGEGFLFRRLQSDRILDVAEVTDLGMVFFGDAVRLRAWLTLPNQLFGGIPPLELLADSAGSRLVCEELGRMEHGIFA